MRKVEENKSRQVLILILFFLCVLLRYDADAQSKPNIIIILADDLGYADVGFNGSKEIPTPNIDRIASNGVVFTDGYVTYSVCGPSRAGLITGRYQNRFGYATNPIIAPNDPNMGLPLTERTLATELKTAGYTNAIIGKWHLGTHESLKPDKRGFDQFYGFLSGGHRYFPDEYIFNDLSEVKGDWGWYQTRLLRNNVPVDENEYLTDALTREAVAYIKDNKDNPFFLYLAYNAPHGPLQATQEYLARFDHIKNKKRKTYAAMVSAMDDGIGRVLDVLKETGTFENTIVFFLSDNGGPEHHNASDNGPLRDGKGSMFEGGVRVPFAMQWPSKVKAGQTFQKPIMSFDIFATACEYAGVKPQNRLDGINIVPYINGEKTDSPHKELFWVNMDSETYGMRMGNYKLVTEDNVEDAIFDLSTDLGESNRLNSNESQRALKSRYTSWRDSLPEPQFMGLGQRKLYEEIRSGTPEGYKLMWSDEFNQGDKLNDKNWQYEEGFVRNKELQWYTKDNATIVDGKLIIEARREVIENPNYQKESESWKENREVANYTSSCIKTKNKYYFQYGVIEVKAKIDTAMGLWPAIWLLGKDKKWPACGEIDMMEFYRYKGEATILANTAYNFSQTGSGPIWNSAKLKLSEFISKNPNWPNEYHIWKMDWDENTISLYLDDQLLNQVSIAGMTDDNGFNPFRQPQYILLNMAIGENGGDPRNTSFPKYFEIDYVRVYQKEILD